MDASALKVGMLVTVGPAYRMAEKPPYIGNGTYKSDQWTGQTMRVVALRTANPALQTCASAALTDPSLVNPDASDEIVDISTRRLTPAQCTTSTPATAACSPSGRHQQEKQRVLQ